MVCLLKESWYWLANGLGWGAVNTAQVLALCPGGAKEVAEMLGSQLLDELLTQKQAERLAQTRPEDFSLQIHKAESLGIELICFAQSDYPEALRNIHNPPLILFVKGDTSLLNGQLSLGLVGARRPSAYGVEAAKAIGRGIALGGAIIVSGLAAGLDAEGHKAALAVNAPTIACIAFGHNHCYPAANRKMMEVIGRYGAVVSEYPPDTEPEKAYFLQRNRLIAGLSHGLIVVEARRHSGTMSTVNFAVDYGREVFAVPGSIFSELSGGTNAMIQDGAYVAASATDVLLVYGVEFKGEDPVVAAAKQAQEGRPAPVSAAAPWQQSTRRQTQNEKSLPGQGQQSLGDLLRAQLGEPKGEVSAAQAIDAFRALQNSPPEETPYPKDKISRTLDEMAGDVRDKVQISPGARLAQKPPAKSQELRPFPWGKLERLDKSDVQEFSPVQPSSLQKRGRGPARALVQSKTFLQNSPASTQSLPTDKTPKPVLNGDEEHVGENLKEIAAKPQTAQQDGILPTAPEVLQDILKEEVQSAAPPYGQGFVPSPVAERKEPKPRADASLSGRLKTLQNTAERPQIKRPDRTQNYTQPQAKPQANPRTDSFVQAHRPPPAKSAAQDTSSLSADASLAMAQLSAALPMSLTDICQNSGLSSGAAMAALTELELCGVSRQLPGRQFVLI